MKAKVIKTGEIVDVYHESQHGQITNIYKESVLVNGRMWTEDELDFSINSELKEVDLDSEIILWANAIPEIRLDDVERLAKHFFELGLSQKGE